MLGCDWSALTPHWSLVWPVQWPPAGPRMKKVSYTVGIIQYNTEHQSCHKKWAADILNVTLNLYGQYYNRIELKFYFKFSFKFKSLETPLPFHRKIKLTTIPPGSGLLYGGLTH